MSAEAMDAGIEVKVESDDEVEPYDGSYACLICTESVRGQPALVCSKCCLLYTSPSPRDKRQSRMPSSA